VYYLAYLVRKTTWLAHRAPPHACKARRITITAIVDQDINITDGQANYVGIAGEYLIVQRGVIGIQGQRKLRRDSSGIRLVIGRLSEDGETKL
jgi:hypothetical protein